MTDNIIDFNTISRKWREKPVAEVEENPGPVEPEAFTYLGDGRVLFSLRTKNGMIEYTMPLLSLMSITKLATDCIDENLGNVPDAIKRASGARTRSG